VAVYLSGIDGKGSILVRTAVKEDILDLLKELKANNG
jgi:hypothetical protein